MLFLGMRGVSKRDFRFQNPSAQKSLKVVEAREGLTSTRERCFGVRLVLKSDAKGPV